MRKLATSSEIAVTLGVTPATVRRLTCVGRIPAIKVNRRFVRYDEAAVIAALRRHDARKTNRQRRDSK